jgi:hypothetical protein
MRLDISWRYRTDQKRQKSETIPGNTKNEVNVPSQAKTDHDDNSLQGGIDDFVSLSASQTEIMSMIWFWQIYQILSHLHVLRNVKKRLCTEKCVSVLIFNNCSVNLYYNNQQWTLNFDIAKITSWL